ncbi:polynucleotide kinase-phosphatase [Hoyosella subflava]|nr:polynucleotide kinase-phosphatase [Hoyosella subflava]
MRLAIPDMSLVVMIGTSGAGKTTFAHRHFAATQILSSDAFRGMVADDANDQSATAAAFDALHYIAGQRLAAGRVTVIDATNVQRPARAQLVRLAREHDVLPVAIVLDVPESVCIARNEERPDRQFGAHVVSRQHRELRRSLKNLDREGFRRVHHLRTPAEISGAAFEVEPLLNDLRAHTGPFDVIGDVHGCRAELEELLAELGWKVTFDSAGRAIDACHPDGRTAVFVGDLVDRGPDTPGVLRLVMGMTNSGAALCVSGNHEQKLARALRGQKVQLKHGIAESLEQLAAEGDEFTHTARLFLDGLVSHYVLDHGRLVVAHAGLPAQFHGRASGRVRAFALYGQTTGETDDYGLPVRYPWATDYRGAATVLYGHTPISEPEWINRTMCLDTGCVFGGRLTALRYPERDLVSVPAHQQWHASPRPLAPAPKTAAERDRYSLQLDDVLGKRAIETRHHGRVTIPAENASAALEVMSRFTIDPRWLMYLPPTMAPCATSTRDDYLEHPAEAFAEYRKAGVDDVVCQEKHMGSRAVILVCRDDHTAERRFGIRGAGAVFTRTGRSFFQDDREDALLSRIRAGFDDAGIWNDIASDWLLLDTEVLPWNAKADGLIRDQYGAVGAAGAAVLPAAVDLVAKAESRGLDVADLRARSMRRAGNLDAYRAMYRTFCWPTSGLSDIKLAPFQLLAAEGAAFAGRPHPWHTATAAKLSDADPSLFLTTRGMAVDLSDPDSEHRATSWWTTLTESGFEGMVVKPAANRTRPNTRIQPAIKVRGREYLRLVYGPDYTLADNLERLRQRSLGRKRSLALREYALGLEAIDRLVEGEPLWRVHECVFGVLALETEPVDPRL